MDNDTKLSSGLIQVIDNFIPLEEQEEIKNIFFKESTFPWFFKQDVTFKDGKQQRPAMTHAFVRNSKIISPYADGAIRLGKLGAEKYGYNFKAIYHSKAILQFPSLKVSTPDEVHIDTKIKHLVVLYYVCDSDGDTIIGDNKVSPKQGRAVLFNGSLYHTAEQPQNNIRCVININVV